jgi:predicted amidohydrolase YtcJ
VTLVVEADFGLASARQPCVEDFAVAIEGESIVATGSKAVLRGQFADAERIQRPRSVLLPALCDAHDPGRGLGTLSFRTAFRTT